MSVTFNDYSEEVLKAFNEACLRALVRCGQQAHGYAVDLVPVDTGNLRNSIAFRVDPAEPAAYIGSNAEYAPYIEFGTGEHSTTGGGTPKKHWVYMGDDGEWHIGHPIKPQPFIKPAIANHAKTYRNIIKDALSE